MTEQLVEQPRRETHERCGRDELNLAEFPLALLADRVPKGAKTLVFEDRIWDKGRGENVTRRLVITAADHYGLPTALDDEVILGLVQWTRQDGFVRRTVPFSRYGLIRLLGWRDEGRSYQRLDRSLRRWVGVTLSYEKAWWERNSQQWVDEHFHLLDHVQLVGGRQAGKAADSKGAVSSFTWNEVIFRSFQSGHLKSIDMALYRSLRRPTAKRLYRFLDKRFHFSSTLRFELESFAREHIGLSRSYDAAQLKRKLQPAIAELEAAGFLEPAAGGRFSSPRRGQWSVEFRRTPKQKKPAEAPSGLVAELIGRGVAERVAMRLVREYPRARIAEKLAVFDALSGRSDRRLARNPAGYLVQSIRDDYALPAGVVPARSRQATPRTSKQAATAAEVESPDGGASPITAEMQAVESYLAAQSEEELGCLTEAALGAAPRLAADGYRRAVSAGRDRIAQEYRGHLLRRYVRGLLGLPGE